jgi:hypothetical protein
MTIPPIDLDAPVAVTPAFGPVPAISVPRRLPLRGTSPSIRRTVGRLVRRVARTHG